MGFKNNTDSLWVSRFVLFGSLIFVVTITIWSVSTTETYKKYIPWVRGINSDQTIIDQHKFESLPQNVYQPEFKIQQVASDLVVPWGIAFTPGSRILVTERSGAIRLIQKGALNAEPLIIFPEVSSKVEEGLMGITLDPDYEENKYVYVSLVYRRDVSKYDSEDLLLKIVRLIDRGDKMTVDKVLLDDIHGSKFHSGSRIKFGPDKKLYITTGDGTQKEVAQDVNNLGGKVLRINSDGSIPEDNPFPNSPVYTLGHRNSQGLAWHPVTGQLYSTEHGPSVFDGPAGGDELNIIEPGKNYGWPIVSHSESKENLVSPIIDFEQTVAPASAEFYNSDVIAGFRNNLFFGGLRGEGLFRVVLDESDPTKPVFYEKIAGTKELGRIREVAVGPDGYVYFSTSNHENRGNPNPRDDKIYRLVPAST